MTAIRRILVAAVIALLTAGAGAGAARAAVLTVNSTGDAAAAGSTADGACDTGNVVGSTAECTLRAAIAEANGTTGADIVDLRGVSGTIQLAATLPSLTSEITLLGPGADRLAVRGVGVTNGFRLLAITSGSPPVGIYGLTLAEGFSSGEGGAIQQDANTVLTLDGVALVQNTVQNSAVFGGAISSDGDLRIRNSTLSGNVARATNVGGAGGSAVVATGPVTITNTTFSGNAIEYVSAAGGALYIAGSAPAVLSGVTFNDNTTDAVSPVDLTLAGSGTRTVRSTVFGSTGDSCQFVDGPFTSLGHNLERGANTCQLSGPGDRAGIDPRLAPLAANGGHTLTHLPALNSPLIDAGDSAGSSTDQRGLPRAVDLSPSGPADPADIGAVELQGPRIGTPVADQPPFAAKLELARARVLRGSRRLDVLARISTRASGKVRVSFRAAGRTTSFSARIDAPKGRVRFRRAIPATQAAKGTGIMTLRYRGDADTQPQEVRLRAAARPAGLVAGRPVISGNRLRASGTISKRAGGVVRLQLLYEPPGQSTQVFAKRARIAAGRYRFDVVLPPAVAQAIAQRRGVVHSYTLYTGSLAKRMRGELASFEVLGPR